VEGRPLDDSELVTRSRTGDVNAYEELVRRYSQLAFRVAVLITGVAADAEEAAQDGFVKAYRALDRFRPGAPFRPWLLEIVSNEARNRRRSAARRATLELKVAEGVRHVGAAPSPEAAAEAAEERESLLRAVSRLGEDDRNVVACRYFLDMSTLETAAVLGCPEGTVKSRLSRALDRLRLGLEAVHG
jgi:RNA polymerase sigma factor (sigma-70 family)